VEVASASEDAVRAAGAVPATVAIGEGRIRVGLRAAEMEALATAPSGSVMKAARPSFAAALASGGWAATTVSATMMAANAAGIRVFATGGIGGVHRGALTGGPGAAGAAVGGPAVGGPSVGGASVGGASVGGPRRAATLDISSDLEELARTPVVVVCAGPKAILDVPATLEYLETRGVPVVTIGQDEVPGFYARSSGIRSPLSVADIVEAARIAELHLGLGAGGLLVCVPVPADRALPEEAARNAVEQAVREADEAGVAGPALTPWLLGRIAQITDGASVRANTALIVNDAWVAGELAVRLASGRSSTAGT
jgi:pseudouridine-5'-phosphate glycosidase